MKRTKKQKKKQCFRTLVGPGAGFGGLVCENIVFYFHCSFQLFVGFVFVFFGFTMVLNSFWWFLWVFHRVLLCFGWSPLVFHCLFCSRNGFGSKIKGKLLENQSQPTPGPLRSFLLSLSLLWPPGLLWLALAPSFLSLYLLLRVIK